MALSTSPMIEIDASLGVLNLNLISGGEPRLELNLEFAFEVFQFVAIEF